MIQAFSPGDLAHLLLAPPRALPNQARSKSLLDREEGSLSLAGLLLQWLPAKGMRRSLIWRESGQIRGLVSARSLSGPGAWEIDYLAIAPDEAQATTALLQHLGAAGVKKRATKIFLRLELDSPLLEAALRADFTRYTSERLYLAQGRPPQLPPAKAGYSCRPESATDEHHLFTLYNAAAPTPIRHAQGMTLREWRESCPQNAPGKRFVCLKGASPVGWFRVYDGHKMGHFELLVHPNEAEDGLQYMLSQALIQMPHHLPIACCVPEFQSGLKRKLDSLGFTPSNQYACLIMRLAVLATEPQLAPAQA